ncbi:MAG: hypothetical protein ACJ789_16765 [Thermomicrobiales bacterium]
MLCRSRPAAAGARVRAVGAPPTKDQVTAAMQRAAWAARAHTRYPERIAEFPRGVDDCESAEDGWFHFGWVGVTGEPDEWQVLYDPVTDEGRLRKRV